jgi:predicted DNA-binding transcriptional regulator YafY
MRQVLRIVYTNYRGEKAERRVVPERIWFGSTDWHPHAQWLLEAFDLDRNASRSFALADIERFIGDTDGHVSHGRAAAGSP